MKNKRGFLFYFTGLFGILFLMGCSGSQSMQLANELAFSSDEISDLTISYDEEDITFFRGNSDEIIIREYMTRDKKSYHAKVTWQGSSLHISEGGKPLLKEDFSRYIEVYLPLSYGNSLTVTTTDGAIDLSEIDLRLSSLRIDSTSGTVKLRDTVTEDVYLSTTRGVLDLGDICSDEIRLATTSGTITCAGLNGHISCTSTSGDVELTAVTGSGDFRNDNSGKLEVTFTEINGDVSLYNKNDNVSLTLPAELEFYFHGTNKNGSISTSFQEFVTLEGQEAKGTVGDNPAVTITVENKNGDISVK